MTLSTFMVIWMLSGLLAAGALGVAARVVLLGDRDIAAPSPAGMAVLAACAAVVLVAAFLPFTAGVVT